jgi:uncharacterized phage protein (TIGR02218 family)
MTDARITQAATTGLYAAETVDARVTQVATTALYGLQPDARINQLATTALYEVIPDARITQLATLALYVPFSCVTQKAQCWRITRRDGTVFAYTTHDAPITAIGSTFIPCDSLRASASGQSASVNKVGAGDIEAAGLISDDGITEEDLYGGLFDNATVEIFQIAWDGSGVVERITRGIVANVEHGGAAYKMTVNTPGLRLTQQPLLTTYSPACRHVFGDANCGIDLGPLTVTGMVTSTFVRQGVNQLSFRRFADVTRTESSGYFVGGVITWTGGANTGVQSEVKSFDATVFELWDVLPNEIAETDTYSLTPGCPKTVLACQTSWGSSNIANFGGFPHMPGTDVLAQSPDAK